MTSRLMEKLAESNTIISIFMFLPQAKSFLLNLSEPRYENSLLSVLLICPSTGKQY